MTAEAQKISEVSVPSSGPKPSAYIVEDPAVTLKNMLVQKTKQNADLKRDIAFNTHELLHPSGAGTDIQLQPQINFRENAHPLTGTDILAFNTGALYKVSDTKTDQRPNTTFGVFNETPFSSFQPPDKNTREMEILRKYFQTNDMSSSDHSNPLKYDAGHSLLKFDLKDDAYQNSVKAAQTKSADSSKAHETADQSKAKDTAHGGKTPEAKTPIDSGTTTVDGSGTKTTTYKDGAVRVEKTDGSGYTLTPKPDGSFVEHKWAKAPEHFWQHDPNKDPDRVLTPDQAMKERHDQLMADAKANIHDKAQLDKFEADLTKLEQRAKKDGVSPAQLAQMYSSVDTLITSTANTPTDQAHRLQLAEQIVSQAADPKRVHQGDQNTCGAADMEVATYLKHPEAAARLVSEVALTGKYTALDGTTIKVDAQPHKESNEPDNGFNRSHASEIFQVAAINVALQEQVKTADHKADIKYIEYLQTDEGEKFRAQAGKQKGEAPGYWLHPYEVPLAYSAITGDTSTISAFQNDHAKAGDADVGVHQFKSEQELNDYLAHAKLPVIISVNVDNAPFDQPQQNGKPYEDREDGRGHTVIITGYEPGPPAKVTVFNTQGKDAALGEGGKIDVHDLYRATLTRADAIKELQKDIADEKKHGKVDTDKELDLVRLEIESGKLSKKDAEREVKTIISHMSTEEQQKDSLELYKLASALGITDLNNFAPGLLIPADQ